MDIAIVILMLHAVVDIGGALNSVAAGEQEYMSSNELHFRRVVGREDLAALHLFWQSTAISYGVVIEGWRIPRLTA